jgi:hypothetical protein
VTSTERDESFASGAGARLMSADRMVRVVFERYTVCPYCRDRNMLRHASPNAAFNLYGSGKAIMEITNPPV